MQLPTRTLISGYVSERLLLVCTVQGREEGEEGRQGGQQLQITEAFQAQVELETDPTHREPRQSSQSIRPRTRTSTTRLLRRVSVRAPLSQHPKPGRR